MKFDKVLSMFENISDAETVAGLKDELSLFEPLDIDLGGC